MDKWITDRLPTGDDHDNAGRVLTYHEGLTYFTHCASLKKGEPWMPAPPSYIPPKTREEKLEDFLSLVDEYADDAIQWTDLLKAREELR